MSDRAQLSSVNGENNVVMSKVIKGSMNWTKEFTLIFLFSKILNLHRQHLLLVYAVYTDYYGKLYRIIRLPSLKDTE